MDRNLHLRPPRLALSAQTLWLAFIALVTGLTRLWHVSARPLHADEAEQAWRLGALLETGLVPSFSHDLHGPLLAYLAWPFAFFGGADSYASLEAWMVRGTVVFTSLLPFAALWLLRRELGRALLWAALLLATAPVLVYQSRYFIHETALAALGLLALALVCRLHTAPSPAKAVALGATIGALLATKLTAVLLFPALLAVLLFRPRVRPPLLALTAASATLMATAFYSNFGQDWPGVLLPLQSILPMLARGGGETLAAAAHIKPWSYHLTLLLSAWENWLWLALAATGLVAGWRTRPLQPGLALAFAIPFLAYSLLPYKTPWLILGPLSALLVLAALGLVAFTEGPYRRLKPFLIAVTVLALIAQTYTALRWSRTGGDRATNPQAYVPTLPEFVPAAERLLVLAREPDRRVLVVSTDYWPLPWYLRTAPTVGYFDQLPPGTARPGDLLVIDAEAWPEHAASGWRIREVLPLRADRTLLALARDD